MDIILQALQLIGYLLLLVISALLWRKTLRRSEAHHFPWHRSSGQMWGLLAMAWTLNLLGNIAWLTHDLVTRTALDTLSYVDLFYVLRYVSLGWALWLYPAPLTGRACFWIGGAMLLMGVSVWVAYFSTAVTPLNGNWLSFLGLAIYPVLDAGTVVLAWLQVRTTRQSAGGRVAILLFCAMASYGTANTINLTEQVFLPISGGLLPAAFWILTDIFLLILLMTDLPKENESWMRNEV